MHGCEMNLLAGIMFITFNVAMLHYTFVHVVKVSTRDEAGGLGTPPLLMKQERSKWDIFHSHARKEKQPNDLPFLVLSQVQNVTSHNSSGKNIYALNQIKLSVNISLFQASENSVNYYTI